MFSVAQLLDASDLVLCPSYVAWTLTQAPVFNLLLASCATNSDFAAVGQEEARVLWSIPNLIHLDLKCDYICKSRSDVVVVVFIIGGDEELTKSLLSE